MIRRIALPFSGWQGAGPKSGALDRWVNSFEQGWVSSNERQSFESFSPLISVRARHFQVLSGTRHEETVDLGGEEYLTIHLLMHKIEIYFHKKRGIMKTTLNIPEELINTAMSFSKKRTKTKTVVVALQEYIRLKKIEKIIENEGQLQFENTWERARHAR